MDEFNEEQHLKEISQKGDMFEVFLKEGCYETLNKYILEEIEKEAFNTYKNVIPENVSEVIQSQMMGKIVDLIRRKIENKIQEGRLAKHRLSTLSDEEVL